MHSSVFKCFTIFDKERKNPFAVKISRDDDLEKKMAFVNEFMITKHLEHPNVVKYIEKFENDITNEIHIVMQYVAGKELD